jgi:alkylation response protein AidB-like acyl-CoA dehydrogenase
MANALITGVAGAYCADEAVDEMFGGERLPILAGMLGPGGTAVESDGGYIGSGTYSFGSGAGHADWLGAGMIVVDGGRPRLGADGTPDVVVGIAPRDGVELLGNWDTMGLVGTGSFDYAVPERFFPKGFTFERTQTEPLRGPSWFRMGIPGFSCAGHSAVALGIAARALEEVAVLAATKRRPAYAGTVAEHPLFRQDLSRHEAAYQAMRAYTFNLYREAQDVLAAGEDLSVELRQRFRQGATHLHQLAADIVRSCYTWGGSDALRNPSPLGRAMRDMSGATQHVYIDPTTMIDAAPALLQHWADEQQVLGG